jgi:nicotinamidase-related amidase
MDFLQRRDDEPLLVKNTRNAFTSTDLQQRLEALGVRRLVITGIQTEQCCETTTRLAADLGYDVDFVTEATLTFPIVNGETGEALSTVDILQRTEFVLRNRFARIARVADVVRDLQGVLAPSAR